MATKSKAQTTSSQAAAPAEKTTPEVKTYTVIDPTTPAVVETVPLTTESNGIKDESTLQSEAGPVNGDESTLQQNIEPAVVLPPVDTPITSTVQSLADPILDELNIDKAISVLADVPAAHYAILANLNRYAAQMGRTTPVDEEQAMRNQIVLLRTIQNLINREEKYFNPLFRVLLMWFEKCAEDCLHPNQAHRAQHLLSADDSRAYNNLIDVLRLLAPIKSRELAKKQINFDRALQYGLTDTGRQRFSAFFEL